MVNENIGKRFRADDELRDTNTCDFCEGNPLELREDDFQNVGVHRHSSGAMGAVPHTKGNPHFIDKGIKCVSGGGTRHGFFFLFFEVGLPYFILPDSRHLLGFLPSLCGCEFRRGIPSRTLENLLAIVVPTHASLDFEGNNLLPF